MSTMNLDSINNIYIIGIEGAGTSALACILKAQGKNVVGSDEGDHFYYDVLQKSDIKVFHKFNKDNFKNAFNNKEERGKRLGLEERRLKNKIDLVIYSTAILPEQNEELKHAMEIASKARPLERAEQAKGLAFSERSKKPKNSSLKILSYPQALGMVFNASEFGIAVCGTHGKTTTTAMLATAMDKIGAQPTALVGSKVLEWGGGVLIGNKDLQRSDLCTDYFVIEADEYQNKLQHYNPRGVILTSADYDHPDFFKTEKEYLQTFKDFVSRIPEDGFLVAYAGDKNVLEISKSAKCEIIFYDELSVKSGPLEQSFCPDDDCHGKKAGCCTTAKKENKLVGMHNLLNATAALRVIQKLKLDEGLAINALKEFQGTARRFEVKGEYNGAVIIDDYAHHPTEVKAALQAAKEKYPDKIIKCIFHPHTFTRTAALLEDFSKSFTDADEIYLLDIFGSAREKQGGVSSDNLATVIKKQNESAEEVFPRGGVQTLGECRDDGRPACRRGRGGTSRSADEQVGIIAKNPKTIKNLHTIPAATEYFKKTLQPNDILITMGAGDVYLIGEELIK